MTLWLKVSRDKYELPEMIDDSQKELEVTLRLRPGTIKRIRSRAKRNGYRCCYVRVDVEEDE